MVLDDQKKLLTMSLLITPDMANFSGVAHMCLFPIWLT